MAEERVDRASRTVRAPVAEVYRAMTEREALEAWLPPRGMTGRITRFEPWPGGGYDLVLTYADPAAGQGKTSDSTDAAAVEYAALVPGERVVQRIVFDSPDPDFAGTMTMAWRLEEGPEGTRVTIEATGVPRGISRADHETAFASSLAHLAAYVEA